MVGTPTAGRSRSRVALAASALATLTLLAADTSRAGPPADVTVVLPVVNYTGAQEFRVIPEGIHTAHVVAIGATGASASSGTILGGLGARVEGDISVTPGTLFVNVGGDAFATDGGFNGGGDGAPVIVGTNLGGGGGGGASDVRTVSSGLAGSLESRLIVAAGGGGAGSSGGTCSGAPGGAGGAGGAAGAEGADGAGTTAIARGGGGGAGTGTAGGTAGPAGTNSGSPSDNGTAGQPGQLGIGGAGGPSKTNFPPGEGGGGGGGLYGGGGGGGGSTGTQACPQAAGGGGGGGGSNLVPPGGSVTVPTPAPDPSVTISYTFPNTEITREPDDVVKTKRRKATVKLRFRTLGSGTSFECSVDEKAYKPCTSPLEKKLGEGKHTIDVRSVNDATGNADQTPARSKFKIVRVG
jgi:hypothetical protein